jgi:aerobic-type carbon monoxide dehydrogenase small subunit (CoxS/CutS family)
MKIPVAITVNGIEYNHQVDGRLLLVDYLRNILGLTGTNIGCDTSQCGACTVLMDRKAVKSCTILATQADEVDIRHSLDGNYCRCTGYQNIVAAVQNAAEMMNESGG